MKHIKEKMEDEIVERLNHVHTPESDGIKLIIEKMWSEERLAEFIDRRHHELCERCPRIAPIVQQSGMSKKEAAGLIGVVYALIEIVKLLVAKVAG